MHNSRAKAKKRQASAAEQDFPDDQKLSKRGRPTVEQLFPGIVEVARKLVEANGFEAHLRRRESTGKCGSTLQNVKSHLLQVVPGLEKHYGNLGKFFSFY